jgi:hypothetical protein
MKTTFLEKHCMFVEEENASDVQMGIIAHGDEIEVDCCHFRRHRMVRRAHFLASASS